MLGQQRQNGPAGRVTHRFQCITKGVFLFNHMDELHALKDSFNQKCE